MYAISYPTLMLEAERAYNGRNPLYPKIGVFYHLFFMLHHYQKTFLTDVVSQYKEYPDWWFYNFHKSFRSLDMFDGMGFFDRKISEEDDKKRSELLKERGHYIYDNKPSHKDFDDEDIWIKSEKDFFDNDEFLQETREKLKPLNRVYHSFEMTQSFGGNMDMVMWLTISNDSDNTLYRFLDEFMAMYFGIIGYEEKRLFPEEGDHNA